MQSGSAWLFLREKIRAPHSSVDAFLEKAVKRKRGE